VSKIIKLILICVLAFFILDSSIASGISNAQDVKTLENGLRIIIKEDHRNPIVVFSVFVDIGGASEGEHLGAGISHLTEHMLLKGSKKYPPGAIDDILRRYGGKIEAFTSYDYTGYRITILKEHIDVALDVLKEMLTSPAFNEKELKKEKEVIEREMDLSKDDPGRKISRLTFRRAYKRHPYRVPIIGYKENFERLNKKDLVGFFESNYIPRNIVIAVVGDIDKDTIFNEVKELFGKIPRGGETIRALPREPEQLVENYHEEKMDDIEGAYFNIAFHSTELLHKDLYALDLLSFILGGGESSILNEEIRMRKGLALSISAYNYTPKYPGLFIISGVSKEENVKETIEEVTKALELVKEKGVSEEELVKAKTNFLAGYIYQKETVETQADDLALGELLTGNPRFSEFYIERIKLLSLAEIQRAAERYLTKENMTVVVLSKSGNHLALSKQSVLKAQEREIKKITLKNKLPVLISEDRSLPIVAVSLLFKGGVRFERDLNNGISKLTALMLMDGFDSMKRADIARLYESKGMAVNTYSGNNSLGLSVNCLKENLEDALRLASGLCIRSSFPENELEREKNELDAIIDMQDNQIFNHGHRLLKELLFKTHPYRFQTIGTHESIGTIKKKDVVEFHQKILSVDNMVLGISGDCNAAEVKTLVEKYFLDASLLDVLSFEPPEEESSIEEMRELIVDIDKEQSLVIMGFHGTDIYDEDRYAVEIMVDILSEETFENIREKKGFSYAAGAFHRMGINPGYIVNYVLTSKKNISKVKNRIFKEIAAFVKKGVSSEDLARSKNHLKAMHQIAQETNSSFIFSASMDELYGLGYENYKKYNINIDRVREADIKRVAERFLTLDKCALVILQGRE